MKKLLLKEKPDLVLLIDSQGFNMPFAKFCKKAGFKTVYYIAPQEWLWGTPRGVKKVAEIIDLIVAIFEKEYAVYKKAGANVVYFGHPLLDIVKPTMSKSEARSWFLGKEASLEVRNEKPVVALCPGSRTQEILGLLPILLRAGELIKKVFPDVQFLIPAASKDLCSKIKSLISHSCLPAGTASLVISHYKVIGGQTYDVLTASDLALCTSGTINLEASLLGVPNLMVYKLSPLTYWVGKYILKIGEKLKYFSTPNLLLDEKVIPELVMGEASPERIAKEALAILKSPDQQEKMRISFERMKKLLAPAGTISSCAEAILHRWLV